MKKKMSILGVLLLAVVVTGYSVSGTYAKYTSTFNSASDSARVAKWAFKINDTAASNDFAFNLFDTILDEDGNAENEVADGLIAPGTSGKFDIKLTNDSEVDAMYGVTFTVTTTEGFSIPLQFRLAVPEGETPNAWSTTVPAITADATDTRINRNGEETVTIEWKWAFDVDADTNTSDTALGIAAATGTVEATVSAAVTVEQID